MRAGVVSTRSVVMTVTWKDLAESFYSGRLGLGLLVASLFQLALIYLQVSSPAESYVAMSFFFVPNVLFSSALASFVSLGTLNEEREGTLFALEIASPASKLGLAAGKLLYSTIVAVVFFLPMFVVLPVSRSLYGYFSFSKIFMGLGVALIVVLSYAWAAVALGSVVGRRKLGTTVLSLWFAVTAWFMRTPGNRVPLIVSVTVPLDALRLSVFKLFWEGSHLSRIEGVSIGHSLFFPLFVLAASALVTLVAYLLVSKRFDVS